MPNGYTTSHIRTSTAGICSQIGWSEKGSQIYSASEKHYSKPPIEAHNIQKAKQKSLFL